MKLDLIQTLHQNKMSDYDITFYDESSSHFHYFVKKDNVFINITTGIMIHPHHGKYQFLENLFKKRQKNTDFKDFKENYSVCQNIQKDSKNTRYFSSNEKNTQSFDEWIPNGCVSKKGRNEYILFGMNHNVPCDPHEVNDLIQETINSSPFKKTCPIELLVLDEEYFGGIEKDKIRQYILRFLAEQIDIPDEFFDIEKQVDFALHTIMLKKSKLFNMEIDNDMPINYFAKYFNSITDFKNLDDKRLAFLITDAQNLIRNFDSLNNREKLKLANITFNLLVALNFRLNNEL